MDSQEEGKQVSITDRDIARTMQEYGGSFVRALGTAVLQADPENLRKVKDTWPDYWSKYQEMAEQISEVERQASR